MRPLSSSHRRHPGVGGFGHLCLATALALTVGVVFVSGCRTAAIPPAGEVPSARGTLAGTVRGPGGVAPPAGRQVEAVEVDTGARYSVETNVTGGFTFMVPPGRYRIEVTLVPGEEIVRDPGVVTVEAGQLVDERNIVLGGAGVVEED